MSNTTGGSYVYCGKVFQPVLPDVLSPSEPPIVLAEVTVDTRHIASPRVLVKFSEFIAITMLGLNPRLYIVYRLIRIENSGDAQILQEWEFEFESSNIKEIANVDTNQPTVLTYCDDLDQYVSHNITYQFEIIQIETNNVKDYEITNKSITGTILSSGHIYPERSYGNQIRYKQSTEPFVKCGKVYNPVLPLYLSKEEKPVKLTQVSFDIINGCNICILIDFSGFVTSVLKEERFNDLTFRLVKKEDNLDEVLLEEWPFRRAFVNDTNIKEPVVYDFCECMSAKFDKHYMYTIELAEAELSEESYYNISQKSMTAQVYFRTGV